MRKELLWSASSLSSTKILRSYLSLKTLAAVVVYRRHFGRLVLLLSVSLSPSSFSLSPLNFFHQNIFGGSHRAGYNNHRAGEARCRKKQDQNIERLLFVFLFSFKESEDQKLLFYLFLLVQRA